MKQANFRDGQRWKVIKAGASLWGWRPCGPGAQEGWRHNLSVGDIITCRGRSMSGGDGVPLIKWADADGKHLTGDCEFNPHTGGMWSSAPADGYLELVLQDGIKSEDEIQTWTSYECCKAAEVYGYSVQPWDAFKANAPAELIERAEKYLAGVETPTVIWDPNGNSNGFLVVARGPWPDEIRELCSVIAEDATEGPFAVRA